MKSPERRKRRKNNHHRPKPNINSLNKMKTTIRTLIRDAKYLCLDKNNGKTKKSDTTITVKTTTYRERTNLKRKTTTETVIGEKQITSINLNKIHSTIGIEEKLTKTNNKVILFLERPVSQISHQNVSLQTSLEEMAHVDPKIMNISQRNFFTHEIELLKRGLKFTSTPKRTTWMLSKTPKNFVGNPDLESFKKTPENSDESLVRNKSNFKPNSNSAAQFNQTDVHVRDNITILERKA